MPVERLVRFFSSLKLTVVCLVLAVVLVFIGTLAQVKLGLYEVQARYFQSFFVYWQLPGTAVRIPVFPGGYLLGGVLLINLFVAYFTRLRRHRPHVGLLLIHFGLAALLLGQLWTDLAQRESVMRLTEGETKSYSESLRRSELAVIDPSDPQVDRVVAFPDDHLRPGAVLSHPNLPFAIRVHQFWPNSAPVRGDTNATPQVTEDTGLKARFVPRPPVTTTDERNVPSAIIELVSTNAPATSLGTWLVSDWLLEPQAVEVQGRRHLLALRLARYYKPFSLTLLEARHDKYKGTEIPRNFSSRVRVRHPASGEDREVLIYMNNPLRYGGFTFYQYQMAADEAVRLRGQRPSSTFQVVQNPGWLMPYVASTLISVGLLWQFSGHLLGFLRERRRRAAAAAAPPSPQPQTA